MLGAGSKITPVVMPINPDMITFVVPVTIAGKAFDDVLTSGNPAAKEAA
jgi:hypothetical protein